MLKTFTYTKANGEVSTRTIYPLVLNDDKIMGIDVSSMDDKERLETVTVLDDIRREYLNAMYAAGFGDKFRQFFIDKMEY